MRALIVEDDRNLSNNICESLNHKFEMVQEFDGESGLNRLFKEDFDVVILDVMMPLVNGYEMLEQMREAGNNTPVLMLTALNRSADQVKGLRAGADDYLTKPFDLSVFHARIDALVRRTWRGDGVLDNTKSFLDLVIDMNVRNIKICDKKLELHGKQFDFLLYLVENQNCIVPKERLFQRIWGFYSSTEFSVVEVYASQIRKELRRFDYEKYLKTIRRVGYILTDDVEIYG